MCNCTRLLIGVRPRGKRTGDRSGDRNISIIPIKDDYTDNFLEVKKSVDDIFVPGVAMARDPTRASRGDAVLGSGAGPAAPISPALGRRLLHFAMTSFTCIIG
jgi:hypothetical protein